MKTLLIETENRAFSVTDRIAAGDVELVNATDFETVEKIVWAIFRKQRQYDFVVIDTLSTLVLRSRLQMGTENAGEVAIWANKERTKTSQPDWGYLSDSIVRLVLLLRDSPCKTILVSHESKREIDGGQAERIAPDLNPAIMGPVLNNSDVIMRLSRAGKEGTLGKETYKARTPMGRIIEDNKCIAKASTAGRDIEAPEIIVDPTLEKLRVALGGELPGMMLIYGTQGSGKTTLACTAHTIKTPTPPKKEA